MVEMISIFKKLKYMFHRFFGLVFLCLFACDDGDIITVALDFDQDLVLCDEDTNSYLLYDTKDDPSEALILIFPKSDANELFFTEASADTLTINGDNTRFIYRTYNRNISAGELCGLVAPDDLTILESYEAATGEVEIISTFIDDDGDGIPNEDEDDNEDGDNNYLTNPLDTDSDGIPDYIDQDDDGDNVLTANEIGDDIENPLNTDANLPNSDELPDYLDTDDDGDGTPTKLEDADGENGPFDDSSEVNGELVKLYLNPEETTAYIFEDYSLPNQYTRSITTNFIVRNINLEIITTDELVLGTYENSITIISSAQD